MKRTNYLDYLRVSAICAVILLHVSALNHGSLDGRSFAWNVLNFYNSISRWSVPVLLMISGALFLPREISLKRLYQKNILRLLTAFCVWSVLYQILLPVFKCILKGDFSVNFIDLLKNAIIGPTHLWFLPMIIGLYMCLPFLQKLSESKEILKYFLLLSFVFTFCIPQGINLLRDFTGGWILPLTDGVEELVSRMHMDLVFGYSFYFLLGHVLNHMEFSRKQRQRLLILGLLGFFSTIALNALAAWKSGQPCSTYYSNFSINVLLESVGIFVFFKGKSYDQLVLNDRMTRLSTESFGAYLIHILFINAGLGLGIDSLTISPILAVPLITLAVMFLSFGASFLLHKIPYIKKWMV